MTIPILIKDGFGKGYTAVLDKTRALRVSPQVPDLLEPGTPNVVRYMNFLLGSTGADSGTTNMNVNGAVTSQEFFVSADPLFDIRIMFIVVLIADVNVAHNTFGGMTALTNGWDLKFVESGLETFIINKAKTGGQCLAQSVFAHAYGDGDQSFELLKWTGTEDAQTIVIPIHDIVPNGMRIGRGTKDKIVSIVNDDLTGLTEFTVRILGYRHYPFEDL